MLTFIFVVALFIRVYFGYETAVDNGYLVSGGSDSYYWERIIDYSADTGLQLYWDPMTNYPDGIRNPRPPVYSMSIVVPATIFEGVFDSLDDAIGYMFLWSTALWGALTVIPTYLLGKEAFGRRVGIVGAFLLAIMPAHVQRSVFSNADHDSVILFLIVLTFYLFMRAVKTQEHKRWVENWRSPASVRGGMAEYFRQSGTPMLYALMAGVAFATVIMAWVGFGYVAVLLLAYYLVQVLLNRFKNADSTSVTVLIFLTMGVGYLLSFPVYYEQSLIPVRFDVPVYLFLGAMFFGLMFVVSRDYPWTLALPAIFSVVAVAVVVITAVNPALGEAILSGQGYFVKSKLYSTIAEARAPAFSELALSFGMVTFFLSMIGLIWAAIKIPRKATAEYIFMVAWLAAAIFMAISAGRFMFNAAPAFAIAAAWVLVIIVDALDFNSVRRSLMSASGSFFRVFKRSVKVRHIVGALFLVFMIVLPNVWHAFDAGIPQEVKPSYDKQIYSSFPSFMRPSGYDEINGSNWYLGAFGYSLPMPDQYFPAAWEWFSQQDADIYPPEDRPAYVAWWDYGFECIQEGGHPTVADNFQFGYQLTGNVLMAQSEDDAIALFAYRLIQSALGKGGDLREDVLSLVERYGVSRDRMLWIYSGPGQEVVDEVLSDQSKYGPMAYDLSDINARIVVARVELTGMGSDHLVSMYRDLCGLTGWEIRYFNVDARMFPTSGYQTGIFYAPAKLSDRRMSEDATNIPIDFFTIKAVADTGREYDLDEVTQDMTIVEYKIQYTDMFYDSMFYRAMGGYSGSDVGLTNDGLVGHSGVLSREQAMPGWNMSHFRLVYRTAYFNPYPPTEIALHRDEWRAISWSEAAELKKKINAGEMEGSIDDGAYTLYTGGLTFLKYYHGAIVNGTLTTEEGYPVAGIRATVTDEYGIPHDTVLTDAEGHYSVLAPFGNVTLSLSEGAVSDATLRGPNVITTMSFDVTDDQAMRVRQDLDRDGVYDYLITRDYVMRGTNVVGDIFWDVDQEGNYTEGVDELIVGTTVVAHELLSDRTYTIDASSGSFDEALPPGRYDFETEINGWTLTISERVSVTAGAKSTQNLAVKEGRMVGNVTFPGGMPAAGIELKLTDMRVGYETTTVTSETGYFSFDRLINSNYELTTTEPGYVISAQQIQINSGQMAEGEVIAYPSSTMSYRVMSGGSPVPYVAYMVSDIYNPMFVESGTADRYGRVIIELPEGHYTLYATYATGTGYFAGAEMVRTVAGATSSGTLELQVARNVTGAMVSPTGIPVKNEFVFFESADGARAQARTSGLGSFDIRLPAGTYEVTSVSQLYSARYAERLVVDGSDMVGLRLKMAEAVVVSGTMYLDLNSSGDYDAGELGGVCKVRVTDMSGFVHTKMCGADGAFLLVVPMADPFTVSIADDGYSGWSETFSSFTVKTGGVTLLVEPDDVTVSGRLSYDGSGMWGIAVRFVPKVEDLDTVEVMTGVDGAYAVALPPCEYTVEVDHPITATGDERYQSESELSVLPSAMPQTLDIAVAKRVLLYGQILDADEAVTIQFRGPEEVLLESTGMTYSVYLVPGTYMVYARGYLGSVLRACLLSVDLLSGSTELTLALQQAYDVTGKITAESLGITTAATIEVVSATGYTVETKSGMLGDYSITLPPGEYEFSYLWESMFSEGTQKLYVEYYAEEDASVTSPLELDVDLPLRMDNVTFSGALTDLYGSPLSGMVELTANSMYGKSTEFYVGPSGSFAESVQPGDYTIYITRPQDGKVYLSSMNLLRNTPVSAELVLSPGRHLTGLVTVADDPAEVELSVATSSAKLALQTPPSGYFDLLVPQGTYLLTASATRVENGITIFYGLSRDVVVGSTDVYRDLPMDRDTRRTVSAYWNKSLMQTAAPESTVTYVFTITNTGNIEDTFLVTFPGTGHEVTISPSTLYLDFGVNNVAYVTAEVKVGNSSPAGETLVQLLVRSKTLSTTRANIMLYVDIAPSRSVEVGSLNESKVVSGLVTYTKFAVLNTGNIEDSYSVAVSNLPVLAELGWYARLVDGTTMDEVTQVTVDAFSSSELYVEFKAIRSGASPSAEASVLALSANGTGISSYGLVSVILPDLTVGPGDVTAERDDVSYEYDMSDMYLDIVLVIILAGLVVSFVIMRKRKGLGKRSGGEKK